jgi:hypothetical protein
MNLKKYDEKCVRIEDTEGNVFEGICWYSDHEYNDHEWGRDEECLQMANFLFFKKDIRKIESLENHRGPYGKYTAAYGLLEEMNVKDGIDSIESELECEEDEHVLRLLACLEYYMEPVGEYALPWRAEVIELLRKFRRYTDNEEIAAEIDRLLKKWE